MVLSASRIPLFWVLLLYTAFLLWISSNLRSSPSWQFLWPRRLVIFKSAYPTTTRVDSFPLPRDSFIHHLRLPSNPSGYLIPPLAISSSTGTLFFFPLHSSNFTLHHSFSLFTTLSSSHYTSLLYTVSILYRPSTVQPVRCQPNSIALSSLFYNRGIRSTCVRL
jgi:hypothetical protein